MRVPTTVFQSAAVAGNYNIVSNGSGYTFPLSLVSGSLPGSNVNISAVSLTISQTYQFSNRRLAVIRNEATGADLCAAFTTSGNSATSNANEALNLSMYTTLGLYSGYNPLTIRVRGAGKGTSSSDGNVMSIRDGAVITLTVTWEYSFTKCTPPPFPSAHLVRRRGTGSIKYAHWAKLARAGNRAMRWQVPSGGTAHRLRLM